MQRCCVLVLSTLLVCAPLSAQQVTIQHGGTLSQLINNLYGGDGIQLADTGHQAHFGESGDFQNFTTILQSVLQSRSFIPVPATAGLVSYRFNEATGTYERVAGSLGPILAESGTTTGKGNFNMTLSYTFADYQTIDGHDNVDLVLHHCLTPDCTFGQPPSSAFLHDTIDVQLHYRLKSQGLAFSAVYGLSDRVDVGLVLPLIRNDLEVFSHAFIVYAPGSTSGTHRFDANVETPDQLGTGTAVGIGDMVLRGKMRLPVRAVDSAVMADVTLPTGDVDNFLGTGHAQVRAMYIVSKNVRRLTPHLNVGYQARIGDMDLSFFDYRLGTEILFRPQITFSTEILGIYRPHGDDLFHSDILQNEQLIGKSEIDGAFGGKWKIGASDRAFVANLLVPLDTSGVRPKYVLTVGLQSTF